MSESDKHLSVSECRTILGDEATGMSDTDIERLRDRLEGVALAMMPAMRQLTPENVEAMRWAAYAFRQERAEELMASGPEDDGETAEDDPCPVQ